MPGAQPLAALLDRERLVVGADPGRRVRLELLAEDAGRVTVDVLGALERELLELGRVAGDHAREVHHLGEPEHAAPAHQRLEVARRERPPRRLERGRGDAGRRHEEDLELEARRRVVQPVDAVRAEHVRDLVRVGDDRRRAEREHEPRELVDEQLHRLEVHVRVDEARARRSARRVDRLARPRTSRCRRSTPSTIATSASSHSRVKTDRTRPPRTTRSAGSSPRATARRRARRHRADDNERLHRTGRRRRLDSAEMGTARRTEGLGARRSGARGRLAGEGRMGHPPRPGCHSGLPAGGKLAGPRSAALGRSGASASRGRAGGRRGPRARASRPGGRPPDAHARRASAPRCSSSPATSRGRSSSSGTTSASSSIPPASSRT